MHTAAKIILLTNSFSGKGKALETAAAIGEELRKRNIGYEVCTDNWPADLSLYDEVWLTGGDGTVNYFINKYPGTETPVAIFKGGTGNDLAWKLYGEIPLAQQVGLVLNGKITEVDLASCNGRLYANSLGIGFDGAVLKGINTVRRLGGHLGYLFAVLKNIFSFREYSFRIIAGDQMREEKYLLVIANNSSRTGGGFMVTPRASLTDGLIDLLLCKKLPVLKRLRYLPVIEKGKHLSLPFIDYCQYPSVSVQCEQEVYAQLDGELISGKAFNISISEKKLKVKA